MQTIETEIEIVAPVAEVWSIFSDFGRWPEWNPFVQSVTGDVKEGERIKVRIQPPGGRGMTFTPTVLSLEADREFRWLGKLLLPGIFDGEHQFILEPIDGSRTRFVQREEFRGLLVGLMMRMVRASTTQGFEDSNQALKERVENA